MSLFDRVVDRLGRRLTPSEPGGLPFDALYPTLAPTGIRARAYPPIRFIAAATSPVMLAPANAARTGIVVQNDSSANLYVAEGAGVSTSSYTAKLPAGGSIVLSPPDVYGGDVWGIWDALNGAARVTETT